MVVVYSTPTCPKCNVIKSKLKSKNIELSRTLEKLQADTTVSRIC